jgi:hypothetical protein
MRESGFWVWTLRIVSPVATGMVLHSITILHSPLDALPILLAILSHLQSPCLNMGHLEIYSFPRVNSRDYERGNGLQTHPDRSGTLPVPAPAVFMGVLMHTKMIWDSLTTCSVSRASKQVSASSTIYLNDPYNTSKWYLHRPSSVRDHAHPRNVERLHALS